MNNAITLVGILVAMTTATTAPAQRLVAHRGASHDAPENTLAAFKLAWEQGADGVEGDFYLTADGRIVCIHDADTKRVAGKKLVVSESTFEQLRALDVGSWKGDRFRGERIPTFREVAATLPKGKLLVAELKSGPEIVAPLADAIEASGLAPQQVVIISFHQDALAECARRLPRFLRYWLTGFKKKAAGVGGWAPSMHSIAASLQACHATGLGAEANERALGAKQLATLAQEKVDDFHVWTVDDPTVARFYLSHGAEWITTNRPAWLREQLATGG